jgi:hypothetical protein
MVFMFLSKEKRRNQMNEVIQNNKIAHFENRFVKLN